MLSTSGKCIGGEGEIGKKKKKKEKLPTKMNRLH